MTTMQFFPPLDAATEEALRSSIRRFGVLVPIAISSDGELLDGHHRRRIALEEGVPCPTRTVDVPEGADATEVAATLNLVRRHLSIDTRREIVTDLRAQGHSIRAIAAAVGVSKSLVAKDIDQVSTDGHLPDEITGADGKTYPATRPTPEPVADPDDFDEDPEPEPTPVPAPPPPTPEEQRAIDLAEADKREANRIERAISVFHALVSIRTNPRRDLILAHLCEPDRAALNEIDRRIR